MLIDQEQATQLLGPREACSVCGQKLERVYCRDCDEFVDRGHEASCPLINNEHVGHRLQRQQDDVRALRGF